MYTTSTVTTESATCTLLYCDEVQVGVVRVNSQGIEVIQTGGFRWSKMVESVEAGLEWLKSL